MRLQRESKERSNEKLPDKASPFHNANHKKDMEKIEKQGKQQEKKQEQKEETKEVKDNGRPPFTLDEEPRKKRVDTPRSQPGLADLIVWTSDAFDFVSDTINKAYLGANDKSNLRQLTKAEVNDLEKLKVQVMANLNVMSEIDEALVFKSVSSNTKTPLQIEKTLSKEGISTSKMIPFI